MKELDLKDISALIADNDDLNWMIDKDSIVLWPCFAPEAYEVEPGETVEAGDHVLAVISGAGTAEKDEEGLIKTFTASEQSVILSFGKQLLGGTCFGMGCMSIHMRTKRFLDGQSAARD